MDFHGVVSIVKDFYTNREKQEGRIPVGEDVIYGRVCGTDGNPPEWLSSDRDKRTVFLFGPDAIRYVTTVPPLELLYKLGADKQYLLYQARISVPHTCRVPVSLSYSGVSLPDRLYLVVVCTR